jgi:DNA-binding response OmpR family regulator
MHALIIEDEPYTADLIQDALSDMGFSSFAVAATEDGAVAAARQRLPDLICADVTLQQGSGIEAVRTICDGGAVATVFVTATPWRIEAKLADAITVVKPFTLKSLYYAIGKALDRPAHGA